MEYRVLGRLEVLADGVRIDVGSRQQRVILAMLLVNANQVVPTDLILEELWPDDPNSKENALWVYISRLRSALEPNRAPRAESTILVTRDHGYSLVVDPNALDALRFERAVESATALVPTDPSAASQILRGCLAEWRGEPYEDFAYNEFVQAEIARLDRLRARAVEARLDAELALGLHREVLGELEALARSDPYNERLIELLMLALYRSGQQAAALRAYQQYRRAAGEELGIEPSPVLARLEEQILLHDTRIEGPSRLAQNANLAEDVVNPFKGLHAFTEADVATFFGRDRLVADMVRRVAADNRLVALVGSSGSGKSSCVRAGFIPALRKGVLPDSQQWLIAQMVPGARPFVELEAALLRSTLDSPDSLGDQLNAGDDGLLRAALRLLPGGAGRLVLVIDQFEELFTLVSDTAVQDRFIRTLDVALEDPHNRVLVVITLRADFYDRPLAHSSFGSRMGRGVVNVTPMTPAEFEDAAVQPAALAGVTLSPALMARLLTDVAGETGGLPLFQYVLTELFDRRSSDVLSIAEYEGIGGVSGAMSRRAEELYQSLDATEQSACRQLFLRLVTITSAATWTRRRVGANEILGIVDDAVDLQSVLDRFAAHRLLTFDRDLVSGSPTVELAHEALLGEWQRLTEWIDEGRVDVVQHARFVIAMAEWSASGEKADYLLSGERLADYSAWVKTSALRINVAERRFLETSRAGDTEHRIAEEERSAREELLGQRARRRLQGLAVGGLLLAVILTSIAIATFAGNPPAIAVVHGLPGDFGVNDLMVAGSAEAELSLDSDITRVEPLIDPAESLRTLAESGMDLIVVSSNFDADIAEVALDYPDVRFVALDPVTLHVRAANITKIHFASETSGFLAGVAAALSTETRSVAFIGSNQTFVTEKARAGFEQGVRYIDQSIVVRSTYLGPTDGAVISSRTARSLAVMVATEMYGAGVDVIYHNAGSASDGILQAAVEMSSEQHRWYIGNDVDEWLTHGEVERRHILTSAFKRFDSAVGYSVDEFLGGTLAPGAQVLGLDAAGVGLSNRGNHLDAVFGELQNIQGEVAFGHIPVSDLVTTKPEFQYSADVVIELEMTEFGCTPTVSHGGAMLDDGRIRVEPDSVVLLEISNATDRIGGLAVHEVEPEVGLDQIIEEVAKAVIPASSRSVISSTLVAPRESSSSSVVVLGRVMVLNCFLGQPDDPGNAFPAALLSQN